MGRRYRNPPIIEALCEFRFEPGTPWDLAIPGLVYEKIKEGFPKRRLARVFEASVTTGPEGVEQQMKTADRMQFLRDDEKALIQVGTNMLAVNHLKPYPTWQEFAPLIRQGFDAYCQVTSPKGIQRVGLRYINRIEVRGQRIELEHYLEFRPFAGPALPQDFGAFIVGVQIPYEGTRDALRLQAFSAALETPNVVAVMLDLDYYVTHAGQVSLDNVVAWVETAHDHVEEAFEACITERLRMLFEEAKV
jgi:uncharacterized protein (TIGR04255 family)